MWTYLIIKEQMLKKIDSKVDFQMLVIKTHLCVGLFYAWTQLNERKAMIYKGWKKTSLFQSFNPYFQLEVLGVNVTKLSFSSNLTEKIDICDPIDFNYNYPNREEDT
jgi:hypothetical protein